MEKTNEGICEMAYQYVPSQTQSKKIDKASVGLMLSHMIYAIVSTFSTSFLVSFIVNVNAEKPLSSSITTIAIFYIVQFFAFALAYFLTSFIVDKTGRIWIYRIGILFFGSFILMLIFVGEELAKYIALAGILYGMSEGIFFASYNVLKGEMVPRRSMSAYATWCLILDKIAKTVFPVVLGFLIDTSTFFKTAIVVLVLVAIQFGVTFLVKSQRPDKSSFDFFKFLKTLKKNDDQTRRLKRIYGCSLLYGFKTIFATVFSIVTIYTFKTNINLGIFTAISSLVSILALYVFKRFTKEGNRTAMYMASSIVFLISSIVLVLFMNKWTYVIYNLVDAVCLNLFSNGFDIERNTIIKKIGRYDDIAEHNCLVEILFSISRAVVYCFMLVLGLTLDMLGLKICIVVSAVMIPVMCIFLDRIEKVECQYSLENITNASCGENETEIKTEMVENDQKNQEN